MAPRDPTPHGGEAFHELPDRAKIPEPKPGGQADKPLLDPGAHPARTPDNDAGDTPRPGEREIRQRPPLPESSEVLAADVEDEDADPVKESGPGVDDDDGKPSVTQQPVR